MSSNYEQVVIVDVETVTLAPQPGSIWEISLAGEVTQVVPFLENAQPEALAISGFAGRFNSDTALYRSDVPNWIWTILSGIDPGRKKWVVAGSNPAFDIAHLEALFNDVDMGHVFPFRHHGLDIPSMVAEAYGFPEEGSLSLQWAAETCGIDFSPVEAHTADYDAQVASEVLNLLRVTA